MISMSSHSTTQAPIACNPSPGPKNIGWSKHVWIAFVVVATLEGGVAIYQSSLLPSKVRPLRHALGELPLTLGSWTGKNTPVESIVLDAVGAEQQVDRLYTSIDGRTVSVHVAAFRPTGDWTPHDPPICYRSNGWKLLLMSTRSLPDRPQLRIALQTCEQHGERVTVAYWYQMGNQTYEDRNSARGVRRSQWGREAWSPLLKSLLQIDDIGDDAESRLVELASRLYDFNCTL
jgi:EpsI family protein